MRLPSSSDRLVLGALTALFAVPAAVLVLGDPPSRLGFQMYSGYGEATATWTDAAGRRHEVDLEEHVASPRIEVDWTTDLPDRLCERIEGATSVTVRQTARGAPRVGRAQC